MTSRRGAPRLPTAPRARRIAALVAALFSGLAPGLAWAFDPFVVRDIRIEGIQRTEPGTVFAYLPVRVGETFTEAKSAEALRALFATGFFRDVRLEAEGDVLVVYIEERPAIASVTITGMKEFNEETLKKALRDQGLAESRIFDRSLLERAEQELKRQYLARGKYAVRVTTTQTPLERNRVGIAIAIEEGATASISSIRFVGNRSFSDSTLLGAMKLTTPGWFTWYTKADQYSREKLAGDLEAIRSYYLDRGYLEVSIDSAMVAITPDKENVELVVTIAEGERFTVGDIAFGGNTLGREDEFRKLLRLTKGQTFSGAQLTESTKAITEQLGRLGYAFANVNAVPEVDREKREASFTVFIDPGRRVYVRRINITGNTRTRDEVIRREMRQFEDAWYDADRIRLSRDRINRLGYFTEVDIDNRAVPDAPDQVDLNVSVKERPTGNFSVGIGVSSTERIILTGSIVQENFLGSGKSLALNVNTSRLFRTITLSYTDPYFTADGISRGFDLYTRTTNARAFVNGADYVWRATGTAIRFGVPYTEIDRVFFGLGFENNSLDVGPNAPARFRGFVTENGTSVNSLLTTIGWQRDTRDSGFTPTRGRLQTASAEIATPVGDLRYVRASYNTQWFFPVSRDYTLALQGDIGLGKAYGGSEYPFFKNFFAGGIGSVRGYAPGSIGPRETEILVNANNAVRSVSVGGQSRLLLNSELLFPLPGTGQDRTIRGLVFADAGSAFPGTAIQLSDMRYAVGFGLSWLSPVGPLKLSFAFPLRVRPDDRTQRLQFTIGTAF